MTPLEDAVATISDLYEMADVMVESQPQAKGRSETSSSMRLSDIKSDQYEEGSENGKWLKLVLFLPHLLLLL